MLVGPYPVFGAENLSELQHQANQGYAAAQNNLGVMYAEGRGVSKDDDKAVEWYRKAADQGYERAIHALKLLRLLQNSDINALSTYYAIRILKR